MADLLVSNRMSIHQTQKTIIKMCLWDFFYVCAVSKGKQ